MRLVLKLFLITDSCCNTSYVPSHSDAFMLSCTSPNCQKLVRVCAEVVSSGLDGEETCLIVVFTVGEAHRPNWHRQ